MLDIAARACYRSEHMHKTKGDGHVAKVQEAAELQMQV
jgi:hypothetical protein